ncbi:hypothetical protein ACJJTC_019522 [Scirpophaga incertulas]
MPCPPRVLASRATEGLTVAVVRGLNVTNYGIVRYRLQNPLIIGHHTRGRNTALRDAPRSAPRVAPINYGGHLTPPPPTASTHGPRTITAAESARLGGTHLEPRSRTLGLS